MRLVFDIETNGLLDQLTAVHVLSVRNPDTGVRHRFVGDKIADGLALLDTAQLIAGHNIIAFDLPALFKVYGWRPKAELLDTFLACCLLWPDNTGNSLEDWGQRLGVLKTDYKAAFIEWIKKQGLTYVADMEWANYNPVMGDYCDQDCVVTAQLLTQKLDPELKHKLWAQPLRIEQAFAKDFAIQGKRGVMLDKSYAEALRDHIDCEMSLIEEAVLPQLPEKQSNKGELADATPPKQQFKKDGTLTANVLKWFDETAAVDGTWRGLKYGAWHQLPTPADAEGNRLPLKTTSPMTLANQEDLKCWLMDMGWEPTLWNYKKAPDRNGKLRLVRTDDGELIKTLPKLHDKGDLCPNLEELIERGDLPDIASKVVRWVIIRHRRGVVNSLLENVRPDGTVRADGFTLGTPTARVRHRVVANLPKAEETVVLGKEVRQCLRARPGRVFAGIDASGLEMRMLAHYVNNPELTDIILSGTKENGREIHTLLWKACGEWVKSRSVMKAVNYGWLYGASDKKLGQTAGHGDATAGAVGKLIRATIENTLPGMAEFMEGIDASAKRGYIFAIDGRRIKIRSKHATLNMLLQSAGSIVVKVATLYMNQQIRKRKLRAWMVIHYHDEVQLDCHPDDAAEAGQCFIDGLKYAEKLFDVKCPLDGECKLGSNWAETH